MKTKVSIRKEGILSVKEEFLTESKTHPPSSSVRTASSTDCALPPKPHETYGSPRFYNSSQQLFFVFVATVSFLQTEIERPLPFGLYIFIETKLKF